jgi:hypothetical protein
MFDEPCVKPVDNPPALTVATLELLELQVTELVRF